MDWALENNVVDGLFFCATLTSCRRGHTPFVQAGAETSETGAEAVKLNPVCSRRGHPRSVGADVEDESTECCRVVQPLRIPSLNRPERRTFGADVSSGVSRGLSQ